jgi:hypothetical protein
VSDKIIRFPGGGSARGEAAKPAKAADTKSTKAPEAPAADGLDIPGLDALSPDQRKAIGVVLSGMAFVLVGIKPTERGADFFTAISGEAADLRNAAPHLSGVIDRALSKRGI